MLARLHDAPYAVLFFQINWCYYLHQSYVCRRTWLLQARGGGGGGAYFPRVVARLKKTIRTTKYGIPSVLCGPGSLSGIGNSTATTKKISELCDLFWYIYFFYIKHWCTVSSSRVKHGSWPLHPPVFHYGTCVLSVMCATPMFSMTSYVPVFADLATTPSDDRHYYFNLELALFRVSS